MRKIIWCLFGGSLVLACDNQSGAELDGNDPIDNHSTVDYNTKFENAQATESGVKYLFLEQGTGKKLVPDDKIRFHYIARLMDGTEVESSYVGGEAFTHTVGSNDVITGLSDGISQLSVGDIALLWVPSQLAYGDLSSERIPANSDLVYQIEILEVIPPAAPFNVEGLEKQTTPSGIEYYIVQQTTGTQPDNNDAVMLHFIVMDEEENIIETSYGNTSPIGFQIGVDDYIIKGWHEAVALMKEGERARFIIPPDLAYGGAGKPPHVGPNQTLIFDLELVSVQPL